MSWHRPGAARSLVILVIALMLVAACGTGSPVSVEQAGGAGVPAGVAQAETPVGPDDQPATPKPTDTPLAKEPASAQASPLVGSDGPAPALSDEGAVPDTEAKATPIAALSLAEVKPNELGMIMVLEYHVIGDEELRWTRTRENFRRDLEYLYANGYYLVGMHDLLDNRVDVPVGKTPVVLTFDDSNRSQFQFIAEPDGTLRVDPSSGLGILEAFIEEHPDFGRAAVFCLLPGADPPNDLFGQPEYRNEKLQYLVNNGYELCNHTLWHGNLGELDRETSIEIIAGFVKAIQEAVPGYEVRVFNPPHGVYPDDIGIITAGSWGGIDYSHEAILEVSGGAMTAPNHRDTDWLHTRRIQAIPTELEYWFDYFERNPERRYVSDGDPDRVVFPVDLMADYVPTPGARPEESPDPDYVVIRLR